MLVFNVCKWLISRGQEYESKKDTPIKIESPNKARIQKCLRDLEKLLSSQGKGQWPNTAITSLERALCDIGRILDKQARYLMYCQDCYMTIWVFIDNCVNNFLTCYENTPVFS